MRVIGGTARGRRLLGPKDSTIRPTSDRARQSLFDILAVRGDGGGFLDLYAGTGGVGIEALSRGFETATFVERSRAGCDLIAANLDRTGFAHQGEIVRGSVQTVIRKLVPQYSVIFADPPYEEGLAGQTLNQLGESAFVDRALVVIQHSRREPLSPRAGTLDLVRQVRTGDTVMSFYQDGRDRSERKEDHQQWLSPSTQEVSTR